MSRLHAVCLLYLVFLTMLIAMIGQLHLLSRNRGYLVFKVRDGKQFVRTLDEMFSLAVELESGNTLLTWVQRCAKEHWPAFTDIVMMVRPTAT